MAGRPSKYKKEFCQDLLDHMQDGFSIESFPATLYEKYEIVICRDTVYAWADRYQEFSDSKKAGCALQLKFYEQKLHDACTKGVKGWPSGAWVFTMKNKFKWRDNPHEEGGNDDRPALSDIMKSVEKNERINTKKKTKPSKRAKRRSRSSH